MNGPTRLKGDWHRHHPTAHSIAARLLQHADILRLSSGLLVRDITTAHRVGLTTARVALRIARAHTMTHTAHPLIPLHGIDGAGTTTPRALPIEIRTAQPRPTASRDIAALLRSHPHTLTLPRALLMRELTNHCGIGRTAAARALGLAKAVA
jgi:hypothetical protein